MSRHRDRAAGDVQRLAEIVDDRMLEQRLRRPGTLQDPVAGGGVIGRKCIRRIEQPPLIAGRRLAADERDRRCRIDRGRRLRPSG
jgi:hypothetical protein